MKDKLLNNEQLHQENYILQRNCRGQEDSEHSALRSKFFFFQQFSIQDKLFKRPKNCY